jgi:hypothetical protein
MFITLVTERIKDTYLMCATKKRVRVGYETALQYTIVCMFWIYLEWIDSSLGSTAIK